MSRRKPRVQYLLDSGNIKKLSDEEIRVILRATDELIAAGSRNMLVKIRKGLKDKKVLDFCKTVPYFASKIIKKGIV